MTSYVMPLAAIGMLGAIACANSSAQTTANRPAPSDSTTAAVRWPAPVRHMQHYQALPNESFAERQSAGAGSNSEAIPNAGAVQIDPPLMSLPPHHVIQSPGRTPSAQKGRQHGNPLRNKQTHPPHSSLHRRIQPQPAQLPEANRRETWKTPYSYGYFGASGKRQWSKHHGYRDRYTEWRLH